METSLFLNLNFTAVISNFRYVIGVDVGKKEFHACFLEKDQSTFKTRIRGTRKFSNNAKGSSDFINWADKKRKCLDAPCSFVMEATGSYYEILAWMLFKKEKTVHIVLANRAKYYLKSKGYDSKNDKIDSKGLSYLGMEQDLDTWQPMSKLLYKLRGLTRHIEQLKKVKTMFSNQLEGVSYGMFKLESAEKSLKKQIKSLNEQIKELEQEIEELVKTDENLAHQVEILTSIKGVGVLTAVTILAETNGFLLFKNQKQLTSYAGYDVLENQSGQRTGKSKISKKGNAHIRRILHLPAFNMVRYDQGTFKNLYERVYVRTGQKMTGYVAVQRKLLCLLYTLHKNDTPFDPDYHKQKETTPKTSSCEAEKLLFSGKKNKPLAAPCTFKKIAPQQGGATLDELHPASAAEALFSGEQR